MPAERGAIRATVNICDTTKYPNTIGVRARMASTSRRDVLYMRFRVQWFNYAEERWHNLTKSGDSGWIRVGRGAYESLESGYSFEFSPPALLRGKVYFRWRRRGHSVGYTARLTRRYKKAAFSRSSAADPPGYSASGCEIEEP